MGGLEPQAEFLQNKALAEGIAGRDSNPRPRHNKERCAALPGAKLLPLFLSVRPCARSGHRTTSSSLSRAVAKLISSAGGAPHPKAALSLARDGVMFQICCMSFWRSPNAAAA
jgi:hypothetical protein